MPNARPNPAPHRTLPLFALALLLLGSGGVAAAWVAVAMLSGHQAAWMAVVAALDAAWLLRLAGVPRGWPRPLAAVAATGLAIALAHWWIVAAQVGGPLGLDFLETLQRLGPSLTWTLAQLATDVPGDVLWYLAALAVAVIAAR
ncbi:hypothetical protein [Vulcaniibacterium gelatinicum]|uniref:hypothetical protein n=1 Tax=Vulcaniibacterium gelatinicum TaxID=2598725 RepID=UPI001FE7D4C3|nr:hypothetical protein [Vulcaniibacterium gelatinicum]